MAQHKLTLQEQEIFIRDLIARSTLASGEIAGETHLTLGTSDVARLTTVAETLGVFGFYQADRYVREQFERKKRR